MQLPSPDQATAQQMRKHGAPAAVTAVAGYAPREMLAGGYSLASMLRVSSSLPLLKQSNLTPQQLILGGLEDRVGDLHGTAGARRLRSAGYTAADLYAGGLCNAYDMRRAGFSRQELEEAGAGAAEIAKAGFLRREEQPLGYTVASLNAVLHPSARELEGVPLYRGAWSSSLVSAVTAEHGWQ
jgi:hypothetical protein